MKSHQTIVTIAVLIGFLCWMEVKDSMGSNSSILSQCHIEPTKHRQPHSERTLTMATVSGSYGQNTGYLEELVAPSGIYLY